MQRGGSFTYSCGQRSTIQLESEVDANRTDWRTIAQAESYRTAHLREIHIFNVAPHVAAVDKGDHPDVAAKRNARLGVQHDQPVAAPRKVVLIDRLRRTELIERETANGSIAAGEEPLAGREIVDDRRHAVAHDGAWKSRRQTDARAEHDDGRARTKAPIGESLHERLEEA